MQSADYVPGVSGWKIDPTTGGFEAHSRSGSVEGCAPNARYSGVSLRFAHDCHERYVAAGLGLGVEDPVGQPLEGSAACIGSFDFDITDPAEQIRQVIREELRPGGLLHRR